jgi:hypothetical protein
MKNIKMAPCGHGRAHRKLTAGEVLGEAQQIRWDNPSTVVAAQDFIHVYVYI